jgi:hypothetical protein
MKIPLAVTLLLVSPLAYADLPSGKGESAPTGAPVLVIDRHGAAHMPDVREFLRAVARKNPGRGDMISESDLVLSADANAPLEAVADVLSLCAGMRMDNAPGGGTGMIHRVWATVGKSGGKPSCVKVFLPRGTLTVPGLPEATRTVVLVCGGEKPYRLSSNTGRVGVLGCSGFVRDPGLAVPIGKSSGKALDLKELLAAAGTSRDESILFHCGEGGRWGDLVAAHLALNPGGVLQMVGSGYPHLRHYETWQAGNRGRLVPAGAEGLPEFEPNEWALEVSLLGEGVYVGAGLIAPKALPGVLEKEANVAPRDEAGRTRRGLVVIAGRDVPWERVSRFLRDVFNAPARFASASLLLAGKDGLTVARAVPAGGDEGEELPEVEKGASFGAVAPTLPAVFKVP